MDYDRIIRELERRVVQLERLVSASRSGPAARQLRLAKTVRAPSESPGGGDYIDAHLLPNTYYIVFLDGDYMPVHGNQPPIYALRQLSNAARVTAQNIRYGFVRENTVVWVWHQNGLWWFDHTDEVWGKLDVALNDGYTATVSVWDKSRTADTGVNITGVILPPSAIGTGASIPKDSWVRVAYHEDGTPYADMAPC